MPLHYMTLHSPNAPDKIRDDILAMNKNAGGSLQYWRITPRAPAANALMIFDADITVRRWDIYGDGSPSCHAFAIWRLFRHLPASAQGHFAGTAGTAGTSPTFLRPDHAAALNMIKAALIIYICHIILMMPYA